MDRSTFQEDVLKASFHWLSLQLSQENHRQLIALLRDPVETEHWRHQLILQLTAPPVIYCAVVNSCLSISLTEPNSFQYLFKTLARKGVFLDDCDEMIISETILSTRQPFSMLAHQMMINAIMKLYILTHVSIHSVISEVKRVTFFTPSKELPNSSNEALLLWFNKISNYNIHKMKGVKEYHPHLVSSNILEVIKDGQLLASLLHFYIPDAVKWNDVQFSTSLLPEDKSLHNLMMVMAIISSNTTIKCHFDPHLLLLSSHVMLNNTITKALELNVFVFLSSLFLYFKQYVSEQPVKQLSVSNDGPSPGMKTTTTSKLTKRRDLQKGLLPVTKPPSGYFPVCNSREGLAHTVSDSSLCANCPDVSSSASSVSLIDFTKNPSGKSKCNVGVNRSTSKQQITPSSESLNMAQFVTHTSLRIKRPPSGQMAKECFVNKTASSVNVSEDVTLDHEQDRNISDGHINNQQSQSVAIIVDQQSYRWLVQTLSTHGVILESNSIADKVIPIDTQDVPKLMSCKPHTFDNMKDEHSVVPHNHQIVSSKESVRVDNIALLKLDSLPNEEFNSKALPDSNLTNNHSIVFNVTHTVSPDSCEDNANKSQCESNKSLSDDESNQSLSDEKSQEDSDKAKSQSPPVATYMATAEDMKTVAAACYEYVMDMLKNWDSSQAENDNQSCEKDNVVHYLGVEPLTEEASDQPAADTSNEDMQCLAMACYETVMDMIRNGNIFSTDDINGDKPVYYLDVEPSDSYELPLHAYPLLSASLTDTQQYSHLEKDTSLAKTQIKKTAPSEVFSRTDYEAASEQTHSQPSVVEDDTTSQCCMNMGSVDSLVSHNEQTENYQVEEVIRPASTLIVDGNCNKREENSSNDLNLQSNSNHPFVTFIDISDSKNNQEHMKVLESRRQKIKMQLMERDRCRTKKKSTPHKCKDLISSPQSMTTTESNKQYQTSSPVTSQHPATLQDGHVLHFTLGSLGPSQSTNDPLIVNIPSVAMTTALPVPPPLTGMGVTLDTPVVKMAEDHPVPIPYNGPLCYVQPPIKSNKKIICNAISHTCLAGSVNNKTRQEAIKIVEDTSVNHFLVLFRDHVGRKFRGIYSFDDKEVHKIFGAGPKLITSSMVSRVYKYNSGSREFNQLPSINISMSADAFTIHNYIWVTAKSKKNMH